MAVPDTAAQGTSIATGEASRCLAACLQRTHAPRITVTPVWRMTLQGKLEKSLVSFASTYRFWEPATDTQTRFLQGLLSHSLAHRMGSNSGGVTHQAGSPPFPGWFEAVGVPGVFQPPRLCLTAVALPRPRPGGSFTQDWSRMSNAGLGGEAALLSSRSSLHRAHRHGWGWQQSSAPANPHDDELSLGSNTAVSAAVLAQGMVRVQDSVASSQTALQLLYHSCDDVSSVQR